MDYQLTGVRQIDQVLAAIGTDADLQDVADRAAEEIRKRDKVKHKGHRIQEEFRVVWGDVNGHLDWSGVVFTTRDEAARILNARRDPQKHRVQKRFYSDWRDL